MHDFLPIVAKLAKYSYYTHGQPLPWKDLTQTEQEIFGCIEVYKEYLKRTEAIRRSLPNG